MIKIRRGVEQYLFNLQEPFIGKAVMVILLPVIPIVVLLITSSPRELK